MTERLREKRAKRSERGRVSPECGEDAQWSLQASGPIQPVMRKPILVIDDDETLLEALSRFLTAAGFTVVTAVDGREGLARLREHRPGLILLDLLMPVMDGTEFRRTQLADPITADVPVICLTGQDLPLGALQQLGLIGVLKKPFDFDLLLDAIRFQTRYEALFEESFDGILVLTPDGRIVDANAAAADMLGYRVDELRRVSARDLYASPDDWDGLLARLVAGHRVIDAPFQCRRKDGRLIDCAGTSTRQQGFNGGMTIATILREVTTAKRLEAERRQTAKMEAVGRLAGGVAHDFNNLLTVIMGNAELLAEDMTADDPRRRSVDDIRDAASSSARLTKQLLAFSRQQVLQPITLDLTTAVESVVGLLHRVLGEDIEIQLDLATPCLAQLDRSQIEQVILNLAVNARDAMAGGGRLTLRTARVELGPSEVESRYPMRPGSYVELTVSDTGRGIPAEALPRVFDPFFTTTEHGGTGLGLATVYGIVKQSGGFIFVTSEVGHGSTFTLYFPLAHAEDAVRASPADQKTSASRQPAVTATILLAEDSLPVRDMAARTLRRAGFEVLATTTPEEALDLAQHHAAPIDVMLSDIVMPRMSGPTLAQAVVTFRPGIRVVFMTGYAGVTDLPPLQAPATLLHKPFTPNVLVNSICAALG